MILLYGHPKTGKTHLLQQMGWGQDLDTLIWQHSQKRQASLKDLFLNSPKQFQDLEHHALHQTPTALMALGGSTLLRTVPPKEATVIYLHTPFEVLKKRWQISKPASLKDQAPHLFYDARHTHYLATAHLILPSSSVWNIENIQRMVKIKQ